MKKIFLILILLSSTYIFPQFSDIFEYSYWKTQTYFKKIPDGYGGTNTIYINEATTTSLRNYYSNLRDDRIKKKFKVKVTYNKFNISMQIYVDGKLYIPPATYTDTMYLSKEFAKDEIYPLIYNHPDLIMSYEDGYMGNSNYLIGQSEYKMGKDYAEYIIELEKDMSNAIYPVEVLIINNGSITIMDYKEFFDVLGAGGKEGVHIILTIGEDEFAFTIKPGGRNLVKYLNKFVNTEPKL